MNHYAATYLQWVRDTTKSVRDSYPNRYAAASLLASTENAFWYSLTASASAMYPWSPDELSIAPALLDESRYLAILLGSRAFDVEHGGEHVYVGEPQPDSLFGIGLGWLPMAVLLGCELDASVDNANNLEAFSCLVPDVGYTVNLGSASANILTLDDVKLVAVKQIEDNATCPVSDLVDYLGKVAVSEWDFAIADSGDALLVAGGCY